MPGHCPRGIGEGGQERTIKHGARMALAMGPRKKNVHDPGFAKKRDEAQVVEERNHRVGAAARKAGVGFTAKNKRQAVFIFLNEPESSASARLFSLVIVLAIVVSSVSFVAETVPYVRAPLADLSSPLERALTLSFAVQERPQLQQPRGVRRGKKAVR